MITLTLFSRPGCHLCEEMEDVVRRIQQEAGFTLREVDISGDADLERLYGAEIPVLVLNGRKIAKYRIDEAALLRALMARQTGGEG